MLGLAIGVVASALVLLASWKLVRERRRHYEEFMKRRSLMLDCSDCFQPIHVSDVRLCPCGEVLCPVCLMRLHHPSEVQ